jgi:hypothetical protein
VLPSTAHAVDAQPRLRGSSSTKPTGSEPSSRLRRISRSDHRASALMPTRNASDEQREQDDHAVGQHDRGDRVVVMGRHAVHEHQRVAVHRAQHLDRDDRQQHDQRDRAHDRLVVALARVAPAALVDARQHQHGQAPGEHPPDRVARAAARSEPVGPCSKRSWKAR